ncbi:hypothetical protein [Leifsonia sp. Le1]|uniref:hypothetical protein n=1 Tax=Leifsonia sp. Le1 TaxID=3404918 RepID=UPI003EB7AFA5
MHGLDRTDAVNAMRLGDIVGEALRNVATGTARTFLLALMLSALCVSLACFDGLIARNALERATAFVASGGSTLVLNSKNGIDGRRCDNLSSLSNVQAAGATRARNSKVVARALPSSGIPTFEVTTGFLRVLNAEPTAGRMGVYVSSQVSDELALYVGDTLPSTKGDIPVAGTFTHPDDGRRSGYQYSVLFPSVPSGGYDECWVSVWPQDGSIASLLSLVALTPTTDSEPPTLSQLNSTGGVRFDGGDDYQERPSRFSDIAAAIGALLLGVGAIRLRRLSLTSARHLGMGATAQTLMLVIEYLLCGLVAVVLTTQALVWCVSDLNTADVPAVFANLVRIPIAGLIGGLAGTVIGVAFVRERQFYRYFTNR